MIVSFGDKETRAIYDGEPSRWARKRLPESLWKIARLKLDQLDAVTRLDQLAIPPGNHLEALPRDREGQHSIRINDQYRICFGRTDEGPADVEITDCH